jgi:hypothetical protein
MNLIFTSADKKINASIGPDEKNSVVPDEKNCALGLEKVPRPSCSGRFQDLGHSFSHPDLAAGK